MIDWLTLLAPLPHDEAISAGQVVSLTADGEVEWLTDKRFAIEGSWSTRLQVRTAPNTLERCSHVEISGNPVKFFQGHNLWGTDDLPSLAIATLERVAELLHLGIDPAIRAAWEAGDIQVRRVDLTQSFHLANLGEVRTWLRAAEQTAHLAHRGRGQLVKGNTLYFGKNSRRWSLKVYAKGQEIRARGHGQEAIMELPSALAWADRTLRVELTLRSMELKRRDLSQVRDWLPVDGVELVTIDPFQIVHETLGNMTMTHSQELPESVLDELTSAQRGWYHAWRSGVDLRVSMPSKSFYRLRSKLLPHDIDVATLMPKEVSNVVPLRRVLEAVPVTIPDWAQGTPLYFEPRRIA